jgi:error-prone DNA polymerase
MIAVTGRVQREGRVVHVIAQSLTDLSELLRSVGDRDDAFPLQGRGDPAEQAGGPDRCETLGRKPRHVLPDSPPHPEIKVPTRDFR